MSRYVIMARENYPGAPIKEICRCHAWAKDIKNALTGWHELGPLGSLIPKYVHVEVLDLARPDKTEVQMYNPQKNIRLVLNPSITQQLLLVFEQIGRYKQLQQLAAIGKAETDDKPA